MLPAKKYVPRGGALWLSILLDWMAFNFYYFRQPTETLWLANFDGSVEFKRYKYLYLPISKSTNKSLNKDV